MRDIVTFRFAIADWKSTSTDCYDERSTGKELQCLVESFPVNRPGPGVRIKCAWGGRRPPRKPTNWVVLARERQSPEGLPFLKKRRECHRPLPGLQHGRASRARATTRSLPSALPRF